MTTCKNCGNQFSGKYCNNCGEKVYHEKDKLVGHLLEEGFHFITHFEGTLFTTIKAIFTRPGKLSLDYCNGLHKKYFKPLSFFLLLVILYLLFPVFEGLNMQLKFHETHNIYSKYASAKVAAIMEQKHMSHEQITQSFHRAGEKTSKFLLFIIIPFIALVSWLLSLKKRRFYYDNFVFATEACSFFLLWGFLILPFISVLYRLITGDFLYTTEATSAISIISVFMIYIAIAARRFFKFKWWYSILYTLLLSISLILFIEYVYKFILFLISIHLAK